MISSICLFVNTCSRTSSLFNTKIIPSAFMKPAEDYGVRRCLVRSCSHRLRMAIIMLNQFSSHIKSWCKIVHVRVIRKKWKNMFMSNPRESEILHIIRSMFSHYNRRNVFKWRPLEEPGAEPFLGPYIIHYIYRSLILKMISKRKRNKICISFKSVLLTINWMKHHSKQKRERFMYLIEQNPVSQVLYI